MANCECNKPAVYRTGNKKDICDIYPECLATMVGFEEYHGLSEEETKIFIKFVRDGVIVKEGETRDWADIIAKKIGTNEKIVYALEDFYYKESMS